MIRGNAGRFALILIIVPVICIFYTGNVELSIQPTIPWTRKNKIISEEVTTTNISSTCSPIKDIVYVKTHKTASSTIQKVLRGFFNNNGLKADEPFFFPRPFIGGYPGYFKKEFLTSKWQIKNNITAPKYNVLTEHQRFKKKEIEAIFDEKPKFLTILRNPIDQFQSSFNYYYGGNTKLGRRSRMISCFGEPFLQITNKFHVNISEYLVMANNSLNNSMAWFFRSKNSQAYDLGMNSEYKDKSSIESYIKYLDSTFDLVMISDYLMESIVLLKDLLCMDWKKLKIPHLLEGKYKKLQFTPQEKSIWKNLYAQDIMLYEYFNHTFWEKVEKYGRKKMEDDIRNIRHIMESKPNVTKRRRRREVVSKPEEKQASETEKSSPPTSDNIPFSDKIYHVDKLKERILNECTNNGICLDDDKIDGIAEYMYYNNGWCPH